MKKAIAHHDYKTDQYFPAFIHPDGRIETFSPSSFDESRALQIAQEMMSKQ